MARSESNEITNECDSYELWKMSFHTISIIFRYFRSNNWIKLSDQLTTERKSRHILRHIKWWYHLAAHAYSQNILFFHCIFFTLYVITWINWLWNDDDALYLFLDMYNPRHKLGNKKFQKNVCLKKCKFFF